MDLQLNRFERVEEFYRVAKPFLAASEAENCLLIGVCIGLMAQSSVSPAQP